MDYKHQITIRHYIQRHRPRVQERLDWFRDQPSLEKALELAALSTDSQGKRFPHQRRIRRQTLEQAKDALLGALDALRKCRDFDELIDSVEAVLEPIKGIGPLYVYDVSMYVGAKLGLFPEKVYLHAGTRAGAKVLGLNSSARALERDVLPPAFRQLPAHEIEDILCIYKDELRK